MTEGDIRREICTVFNAAIGGDLLFPFQFLQPVGSGSWCLTTPSTSSTFQWSVKDIISAAGKNAIYILAEKEIDAKTEESPSWRYVNGMSNITIIYATYWIMYVFQFTTEMNNITQMK